MIRLVAAVLLVVSLLSAACSSEAVSNRGEPGSSTDPITPAPTADIADISQQLNVVIAPTPLPDGPRPLIVASLLGETGVLAPLDGPALAGVIAEIKRLNDAGGVLGRPVELRRFDTNSRVSVTDRLVRRFVDSPPDLIITSCDTDVSQPALEFADEFGLLTISPCATDPRYLTGGLGSMNYTLGAPSTSQGAVAAAAAFERYGPTSIVLRDVTSPEAISFCDGFERTFRELGGSVVYRDEFSYDTLDPVQDRLAERGGESSFITLCSHVPGGIDAAPSIILILRTLGFEAPLVGGSTLDQPGWFADVPTLGELLFVSWSSTFGNDPDGRVNDLVRSIQQGGSLPPGVSTILGAEAVEAWARAAETAGSASPDSVARALASFNNERFTTGPLSFVAGARMDLGRTYRLLSVVDGELSVVGLMETGD
ncbi:MAG: ABC transporter substrate-binding protein [Acidimicrobiaceae bacterium]|nr:ABC transporter substrate-binding protein [Acidimicrobiaceae bacterium]